MKKVMAILVALSFLSATTMAQVQPTGKTAPTTEVKTVKKTIKKKPVKKAKADTTAKKSTVKVKKTTKKVEVK